MSVPDPAAPLPPPAESQPHEDPAPHLQGSDRVAPPDENRQRRWHHPLAGLLGIGLFLPFGLYYGLRLAGAEPWLALVLGGLAPLARVLIISARTRRLDQLGAFTLSVLVLNTAIGLITGDARLLMALGSWLTALLGAWLLVSLARNRPVLFEATVALMPEEAAARWQYDWAHGTMFRRVFQAMTVGWAAAFLIGAAARVGMAYTLPIDVVPITSAGLLLVLLIVVVQTTKAYARRHKVGNSAE